jgi:hypothetical protein
MVNNKTRKIKKRQFLFNPNDPKKSFDVYIDKNPNDTIPIKYSSVDDVINTIKKLERLFKTKQYSHKRIWQVGMILKVRLEIIYKYRKTRYKGAKYIFSRYNLAKRYFNFLRQRTLINGFRERKKLVFKIHKTQKRNQKYKRRLKTKKNKPQQGGKWSQKYKDSIDCNNPKGFSQKQHCKYGRKTIKNKIKNN